MPSRGRTPRRTDANRSVARRGTLYTFDPSRFSEFESEICNRPAMKAVALAYQAKKPCTTMAAIAYAQKLPNDDPRGLSPGSMKRADAELKRLGVVEAFRSSTPSISEADRAALAEFIEGRFIGSLEGPTTLHLGEEPGSMLPKSVDVDQSIESEPAFDSLKKWGAHDPRLNYALRLRNEISGHIPSVVEKRNRLLTQMRSEIEESGLPFVDEGSALDFILSCFRFDVPWGKPPGDTVRVEWLDGMCALHVETNRGAIWAGPWNQLLRGSSGVDIQKLEGKWRKLLHRAKQSWRRQCEEYMASYSVVETLRLKAKECAREAAWRLLHPSL